MTVLLETEELLVAWWYEFRSVTRKGQRLDSIPSTIESQKDETGVLIININICKYIDIY